MIASMQNKTICTKKRV